jgi:hypothetical protein
MNEEQSFLPLTLREVKCYSDYLAISAVNNKPSNK